MTWTFGTPPRDYVLGHVRAVLPDRIVDDARVVVRGGRIAEVGPQPPGSSADVDGAGLLCLPGIVDLHSDGLEREVLPRPSARLPWEFAMLSFEGKLHAAGITTVFHGAAYEQGVPVGLSRTDSARSIESVRALRATVTARGGAGPVEHRILHRLDVRSPEGLAALREDLVDAEPGALVSHEDHTPGQGQYADRRFYERHMAGTKGVEESEMKVEVDRLISDRDSRIAVRHDALAWLGEIAMAGAIRLAGHDPATAVEIDDLVARGGAVAEFPTTVEAAVAARDRGLPVVAGAPNVLRGGSHSGNVSGVELAERGLLTALASDYLPSGMLAAALLLARGPLSLPAAIGLVTGGAADAAGLPDRGRLVAGQRADLGLADVSGTWPEVRATVRAA